MCSIPPPAHTQQANYQWPAWLLLMILHFCEGNINLIGVYRRYSLFQKRGPTPQWPLRAAGPSRAEGRRLRGWRGGGVVGMMKWPISIPDPPPYPLVLLSDTHSQPI